MFSHNQHTISIIVTMLGRALIAVHCGKVTFERHIFENLIRRLMIYGGYYDKPKCQAAV